MNIPSLIRKTMDSFKTQAVTTVAQLLEVDRQAREIAVSLLASEVV